MRKARKRRVKAGERKRERKRLAKDEAEMRKDESPAEREREGKEASSGFFVLLKFQERTGFWFVPRNVTQLNRPGKEELSKFPAIFRTLGHLCQVNFSFVSFPSPGAAASSG